MYNVRNSLTSKYEILKIQTEPLFFFFERRKVLRTPNINVQNPRANESSLKYRTG